MTSVQITDDQCDFYGRTYWFEHQEHDLKSTNILARARSDLPERCAYWLSTLLRYRLPTGRALEVGCGHGGFVALLRWAGFDASGTELSPWVVEFAQQAFAVPVQQGTLETQPLALGELDLLVLLDVVEHLPDPRATLVRGFDLLGPAGLLMLQLPCYPAGASYAELVERNDIFLKMLIADEHVYLFSRAAMRRLLAELGFEHILFEPALALHDMLVLASRQPLAARADAEVAQGLSHSPQARAAQALLDAQAQVNQLARLVAQKDQDLLAAAAWTEQKNYHDRQQIEQLTHALSVKDTYTNDLAARLAQKERELAALTAHLGEKEQALTSHALAAQQQATQHEYRQAALKAYIAEREQLIGELQARIQRYNHPLIRLIEHISAQVRRHYPWVTWQATRIRRRLRYIARRIVRK